MKKIITDFLFKRRFKVLKNKKGFSLMEVLIAVAIIAIISGIAVPQFLAQRDNAAKVASDTSAGNIAKAFKNCVALNSFGACDKLSKIRVSCPAGSTCDSGGTGGKFCAEVHRGDAGSDFKVCISIDASGTETRTYAGSLLSTVAAGDRCHYEKIAAGSCTGIAKAPVAGLPSCTTATDCGSNVTADAGTNTCGETYTCEGLSTSMTATCDTTTGNCS